MNQNIHAYNLHHSPEGTRWGFRDPGFGLFRARDSGFLRNIGSGFGIAFMDRTRDLALLRSGIREIGTLKP